MSAMYPGPVPGQPAQPGRQWADEWPHRSYMEFWAR